MYIGVDYVSSSELRKVLAVFFCSENFQKLIKHYTNFIFHMRFTKLRKPKKYVK